MISGSLDEPYWYVNLVGLTEEGAGRVIEFSKQELGTPIGVALDPSYFYTLFLDPRTTAAVAYAVRQTLTQTVDNGHSVILRSMLEDMENWLAESRPSDEVTS